jgi:hypothetical protein
MSDAKPVSEEAGLDRRAIRSDFAQATRRREDPGKSPPPKLGDVFDAVASETDDAAELVAVVARVFYTRKVLWARSSPTRLDTWEDCSDPSARCPVRPTDSSNV